MVELFCHLIMCDAVKFYLASSTPPLQSLNRVNKEKCGLEFGPLSFAFGIWIKTQLKTETTAACPPSFPDLFGPSTSPQPALHSDRKRFNECFQYLVLIFSAKPVFVLPQVWCPCNSYIGFSYLFFHVSVLHLWNTCAVIFYCILLHSV